jgi:hypothetical protein
MKLLLIILISFLLLSSPVIGENHKGETLYLWGKYPDYKWMGFGDEETQPKYQGQVKNGKPNGLGVIIYTNGSKYVGGWENGKYQGQGTFTKPDGTKYVGSWKIIDGVSSHWNGEYYDEDGIIKYKWVNGKLIKQYKS